MSVHRPSPIPLGLLLGLLALAGACVPGPAPRPLLRPEDAAEVAPARATIRPAEGAVRVELRIPEVEDRLCLLFPSWIPGDYSLRPPADRVRDLARRPGGSDPPLRLADDGTVAVSPVEGTVRLTFRVLLDGGYRVGRSEPDRTVFCHLGHVLPRPLDRTRPWRIRVEVPEGWEVDGGLPRTGGTFRAPSWDRAIDAVVCAGRPGRNRWRTARLDGVGRLAVLGPLPRPFPALRRALRPPLADLRARLGPPPASSWLLCLVTDGPARPRGGLEHRASAVVAHPASGLRDPERWTWFRYLVAHEYAHAWIGGALRPGSVAGADLAGPAPQPLHWLVEGSCSYLAWAAMVRAGAIEPEAFYEVIARKAAADRAAAVHDPVSAREAGDRIFARGQSPWGVSSYDRGFLIALALDAAIRWGSGGERSLADLLRSLIDLDRPVEPGDVEEAAAELGVGPERLEALVDRPTSPDLDPAARALGLRIAERDAGGAPWLGLSTEETSGYPRVTRVAVGGPAWTAGIRPGDALLRIGEVDLDGRARPLRRIDPGDRLRLAWLRDGRTRSRTVEVGEDPSVDVEVAEDDRAGAPARARRARWLGRE